MTHSLAESLGAGHTAQGWARDFLTAIGAPASQQNVNAVVNWETMESGGGGGLFNPLNSVLGAPGASDVNSVGVKNYTSYKQGIQASVSTFTQSQWAGVVNGFRANNPSAAQAALNAEYATWGGGPINILGGSGANVTGTGGGSAGGASLTSTSSSDPSNDDEGCLWKLGKVGLGPISVGGECLLSRSQGRALLGAVSLLGGATLMLAGLGFIAFRRVPLPRAAAALV